MAEQYQPWLVARVVSGQPTQVINPSSTAMTIITPAAAPNITAPAVGLRRHASQAQG